MSGWNDADLHRLWQKDHARRVAENDTHQLVTWLRDQGCPWSLIGERLGVTKQAAQQRYGSRRPTTTTDPDQLTLPHA